MEKSEVSISDSKAQEKLIQCVPNFSTMAEETGSSISEAIVAAGGVHLIDVSFDPDHARTVITFIGRPDGVRQAVLAAAARAIELIDLRNHRGEHPRIGAVDVVPLVPLKGITMNDCVSLSEEIARDLASGFGLPVYLYEESARLSHRRNLAAVRKGGFEGLRGKELSGRLRPDFGPPRMHPTAGACVVGARGPLIAFNVNLETTEIEVAKKIASKIRQLRDWGMALPGVKAIGVALRSRGCVQVSTNITRPDLVSMGDVLAFVEGEAKEMGVSVRETELVGTVRLEHLISAASSALHLNPPLRRQVVITDDDE